MKFILASIAFLVSLLLGYSQLSSANQDVANQDVANQDSATQDSDDAPTTESLATRLIQTDSQKTKSIESVRKVDEHPLYVMTYHGDYDCEKPLLSQLTDGKETGWACSLFASFGNAEKPLYGRNFDWQDNPALMLFTDPSDGYASVSMVDVSYLGYAKKDKQFESPEGRENLLLAPMIPFDGMNEHGLTVGMAAVPDSQQPDDQAKHTVGGLQIIRMMLDKAKDVPGALELFKKHNVRFNGGPNIHYLIADAQGNSVVIELKDNKLIIIENETNWNSATNFHLNGNEGKGTELCRRFAQIDKEMKDKRGALTVDQSFKLLKNVAQGSTRWSVVYDMKGQTANVAMSRKFTRPHEFKIKQLDSQKSSEPNSQNHQ